MSAGRTERKASPLSEFACVLVHVDGVIVNATRHHSIGYMRKIEVGGDFSARCIGIVHAQIAPNEIVVPIWRRLRK